MEKNLADYTESIRHMVNRIGAEAETPEDMAKLIQSELYAYYKWEKDHDGMTYIWQEPKLHKDVVIIGELYDNDGDKIAYITLHQKMKNKELFSEYRALFILN